MRLIAAGAGILLLGGPGGRSFESQPSVRFLRSLLDIASLLAGPWQIVSLGTGFNLAPLLPANSRVCGAFLSRIIASVRVLRAWPDEEIVVSIAGETPAADRQQFGLEPSRIVGLRDTRWHLTTTAKCALDEISASE